MQERIGTDEQGREILVRSHTGRVGAVTRLPDVRRVEVAISVDSSVTGEGGLPYVVKVMLDPDDPMLVVAESLVGRTIRWTIEWHRDVHQPDDAPIRKLYLGDRAFPVLVELTPIDDIVWHVPDTLPEDWV